MSTSLHAVLLDLVGNPVGVVALPKPDPLDAPEVLQDSSRGHLYVKQWLDLSPPTRGPLDASDSVLAYQQAVTGRFDSSALDYERAVDVEVPTA